MTTLYRFYRPDGVLLYVGITKRIPARLSAHAKRDWWELVARIEMQQFETRALALAAEAEAIRTEAPLLNVQHNRGRRVAGATPSDPVVSEIRSFTAWLRDHVLELEARASTQRRTA